MTDIPLDASNIDKRLNGRQRWSNSTMWDVWECFTDYWLLKSLSGTHCTRIRNWRSTTSFPGAHDDIIVGLNTLRYFHYTDSSCSACSTNPDEAPTKEASAIRKHLLQCFSDYDAIAKRIRKIPCPGGPGSSQDRIQAAIQARATMFLQKNMFPLQVMTLPN